MDTQVNGGVGLEAVKDVVVASLGIEERADAIDAQTPLLGTLPELDSMAVLVLVHDLEQRFGITFEDEDLSAHVFETLHSLATFVDRRARIA